MDPTLVDLQQFQRGMELGREFADKSLRRVAAWAEENPGKLVLAGLVAGFFVGKLLLRPRRIAADLP